jgi:ABC-2 type transport system ATP-binding protein
VKLPPVIDVKDMVLVYSDGTKAVDGVTFDVQEGEFFGFLGPNGAGKSTTIKVLTTLLRKTSGLVSVLGHDIEKEATEIRKSIGVEAQETVVDPDLTGWENMMLQGHLHQMSGEDLERRAKELLELVGIADVADKRAGHYSGGMKKRLDLASALVHQPKVLFLDEPTTGLDPQSRAAIWEYLSKLNKESKITIFLTTQYMEEADKLCDRLFIIDQGKIVANGTTASLKQEIGADTIKLTLEDGSASLDVKAKAKQVLSQIKGVTNVIESEEGITVFAKSASQMIADIVRSFDASGVKLSSVSFSSPTLDDVFLQHTGRRIRTEELNTRKQTFARFGAARRPVRQ